MPEINLDWPLWDRQKECLLSPANDQLFGGASEGGKSYLARVAICLAGVECNGLSIKLIRKKNEDILSNHLEGDRGFRALLYPLTITGQVEVTQKGIRFPNNNVCMFKHCQDERQFDSAQGNESQLLVLDEATQLDEDLVKAFRTWCRMTPDHRMRQPPFWQMKLPWMLNTANPIGKSVGFYRRNYVKARKEFVIEEVDGFRRQYVPSKAEDNLSVDLIAHKARIGGMSNKAVAKALDEGTWDQPAGDFFPQWNEKIHVIPDCTPPSHWFRYETFDWGTAEPAAHHTWAVSDGESFTDHLGRNRWYPRGYLMCYREWYIAEVNEFGAFTPRGLRMRNEDMADGILDRRQRDSNGQIVPWEKNLITLSDSLPFQDRGGKTIAQTFQSHGVLLKLGDTSRIPGWSQLGSRLTGIELDSNDEQLTPMIGFCESCTAIIEYVPALGTHKTNPEDAVESGEATHACDSGRLAAMAQTRVWTAPVNENKARVIVPTNNYSFNYALKQVSQIKQRNNGSRY